MPIQRRTGPSGTSTPLRTRTNGSARIARTTFFGGLDPNTFLQPNPGLPGFGGGGLPDPIISAQGGITDILTSLGLNACKRVFPADLCEATAASLGFGPGSGGSEPPSGDPAIPGLPDTGFAGCGAGQIRLPTGQCVDIEPGGATQGGGLFISEGEVVKGRFGAAVQPMADERVTRRCPKGHVLADDNLCYDSRTLPKRFRKWVPARKPLLTGGDLNAISRASRAAGRMERQQKRLQKLGLLKKSTKTKKVFVCPSCRKPRDECVC